MDAGRLREALEEFEVVLTETVFQVQTTRSQESTTAAQI